MTVIPRPGFLSGRGATDPVMWVLNTSREVADPPPVTYTSLGRHERIAGTGGGLTIALWLEYGGIIGTV